MRAYIDSDILIWHLRGKEDARKFLQSILNDDTLECWIGAMQRAEIVFFMKPAEETMTMLFLSQFRTAAVDQSIVDMGGSIWRKWHDSHGMDINDAFLAATALKNGGSIYTLNVKHYPMKDIPVIQAWNN